MDAVGWYPGLDSVGLQFSQTHNARALPVWAVHSEAEYVEYLLDYAAAAPFARHGASIHWNLKEPQRFSVRIRPRFPGAIGRAADD